VADGILSDGEKRKLLELKKQANEIVATVTDRIEITVSSLDASRRRFEDARRTAIAAGNLYHEALIALAEDEDDDFVTALGKVEKFEQIEAEYLDSGVMYRTALNRLGWELKNSGVEN
jgi:DNA gyrase/topoisomerase IV subunit A